MKKFMEKQWWGGIGVIVTLILGIPALIQLFGKVQVSWLAVTIALSIVLTIILTLITIWNLKLQRKFKEADRRLQKVREFLENQIKEQDQNEICENKKPKIVLLTDPDYVWKLNLDNSLLTQFCGQANSLALKKFHDAKLCELLITITPYQKQDRVSLFYTFYSRWAKRKCTYVISEMSDMHELSNEPYKFNM